MLFVAQGCERIYLSAVVRLKRTKADCHHVFDCPGNTLVPLEEAETSPEACPAPTSESEIWCGDLLYSAMM